MIKDFLKQFGDVNIENVHRVGKQFYQQSPALAKLVNAMDEYPVSAGLFLGEIIKNQFVPSPNLLNLINIQTDKKIILNEKSAWLFVCGRDVFIEGITVRSFDRGVVLVLNEQQEVLGVALKDGKTYNNLYDIGLLLRREQQKSFKNK